MALPQESKEHIEQIAGETLTQFEQVASEARSKLGVAPGATVDALASVNTYTSGDALNRLAQISDELHRGYLQLAAEPAIARVVVQGNDGKRKTFFICRAIPLLGMASYRSPVGRLAELSVGSSYSLPNGGGVVLEQARLHPEFMGNGWDSINTVVEGYKWGPFSVESFRALLESVAGEELGADVLESLLAQESESANILAGIRRSVIAKMGLRDQPILDQYQGEIFRLPLSSRLLILGPPGTGKTTTLIRRLGQKLDSAFLDDDERRIVEATSSTGISPHNQSWLMFTPTDLLKQYVKEAFAREGVPASEERITTWSDYRRLLARRVLGVLRTASPGGTFVLKESLEVISADAQKNMIAWFEDFDAWHKLSFFEGINLAAEELSQDLDKSAAYVGQRFFSILRDSKAAPIAALFTALNAEASSIQSMIADRKGVTDTKIRDSLRLQVNRNKEFLSELATFIDGLLEAPAVEIDEFDDPDGDDDDEVIQPKTPIAKAALAYAQAVRTQCRAHARKRSIGKNSRSGKILEWIGSRTLAESDRAAVGASLLVQSGVRRFVNPVKKYIDGIPKRYRTFRRLRQADNKWYTKDTLAAADIGPLELDVVLLAMLRGGSELLGVANIMRNLDTPAWSSLKPIHDLYKNQILVDEATDFSPVQLACMAALAHPRLHSFFACGDFNQRLTVWGSRSPDEVRWVFPEIEIRTVAVSYRQTRQLNDLANALIMATGGVEGRVALPKHVNSDGVPPVLAEGISEGAAVAEWVAARIQEIESFVQQLPSIAILVCNEAEVQPMADALDSVLADLSIRAVACRDGQVMGQNNDVRVFDVQHIKGLEFEAVFFVGIDRLADLYPGLFDKYLYVGTTRAATYLGVTCEGKLPPAIEGVRLMFEKSWAA